jgi:hypothetical protein
MFRYGQAFGYDWQAITVGHRITKAVVRKGGLVTRPSKLVMLYITVAVLF